MNEQTSVGAFDLQEQMIALVRAFGLHRPDQTPCGQPVSVTEAHALLELSRAEPLAQNQLVGRLRLEKSTVSRLVTLLEQRAWVTRARSTRDGRVTELHLTKDGRRAAAQLAEARGNKFQRILHAIPEEQRQPVLEALHILVEALYDDTHTDTHTDT